MDRKALGCTVIILTGLLFHAGVAQAQWVFLGRKALGAINRIASQGHDKQSQGYDVASVLLEPDADQVYKTAVELLKNNPSYRITHRDDSGRTVEFTDGKISVGIKVSRLDDKVSQFLIGSTTTPGKPSGTSFVVERVLQVCEKMGVHCALAVD